VPCSRHGDRRSVTCVWRITDFSTQISNSPHTGPRRAGAERIWSIARGDELPACAISAVPFPTARGLRSIYAVGGDGRSCAGSHQRKWGWTAAHRAHRVRRSRLIALLPSIRGSWTPSRFGRGRPPSATGQVGSSAFRSVTRAVAATNILRASSLSSLVWS
jgi:hypothetical protein